MEKQLSKPTKESQIKYSFKIASERLLLKEVFRRSLVKNYSQELTLLDWEKLFKKDKLI